MLEDAQGYPRSVVVEGQEIEVEFEHRGRKAIAGFEIDGGWQIVGASYDEPAEYEDITTDFLGAGYIDGDEEEIPNKELDPQLILDLEGKAMDKYEPVKPGHDYED